MAQAFTPERNRELTDRMRGLIKATPNTEAMWRRLMTPGMLSIVGQEAVIAWSILMDSDQPLEHVDRLNIQQVARKLLDLPTVFENDDELRLVGVTLSRML